MQIPRYRLILPKIVALVTRKDRQIVMPGVDFEWSENSWVHNFFRTFELVFGRKTGIRAEASLMTYKDEDGRIRNVFAFHSTEAVLKAGEHAIRNILNWRPVPIKIYIPVLAPVGGMGLPTFASPYLFAIAFVATVGANPGTSNTSLTTASFSFGTTNGLVFVGVTYNSTVTWSSVTCTDGALTNIDTVVAPTSTDVDTATYYRIGTTTASQTVTANASGTTVINICASTYSGVKQTGQPDAHATGTATTGTSFTQSLTTVADNCWMMMTWSYGDISGHLLTAGANTTFRQNVTAQGVGLADTNAPMSPAGSYSMSMSENANDKWAVAIASFAPAVAAVTVSGGTLTMMGVG